MAVTSAVLVPTQAAPTSTGVVYTSTNVTTIIDKFTANNTDATAHTITVYLVASGGSASASNLMVTKNLQPSETYTFPEIVGHNLTAGATIQVVAASATVTIRASGRQVS